jgi:FixJ family two-component response regulator
MISTAESTQEVSAPSGLPVLIVDDNQAVTRALAKLLARHGMKPIACVNAAEAMTQIEQLVPAAAVVDIHLPDLSGLILSQRLRDRFGPRMPIIIVSGDGSREVLGSLARVGATHFFSKPVSAQMLVERLRQLLK